MAGSPSQRPEDDRKIADADWLKDDVPKAKSKPTTAGSSRPVADADHSYDVLGKSSEHSDTEEPPPPPVRSPPSASRKPSRRDDGPETEKAGPPATVDQVWSRGAEWGGHLTFLAIAAAVVGLLIYVVFSLGLYFVAFLLIGLGGAVLIALCYPIFITLERPVRITPEQAAKDYYAMLSHGLPHYPRMWLLLSSAGRSSGDFSTFGEFRNYWKGKLASLQGGKASTLNPLKFQVESFRSEKSAGATSVTARFTVKVFRETPGPSNEVASFEIKSGLVKGPDRMWYLNNGTLPDASQ
jgi:hypothetical protein